MDTTTQQFTGGTGGATDGPTPVAVAERGLVGLLRHTGSEPAVAEHPVRVEELRDDSEFVVRVEVPGLDPDDVDVEVSEHALTIRVERRQPHPDDVTLLHSEFRYGSFVRTVPLVPGATGRHARAVCRDGILEVRVPVEAEDTEMHHIPVTRG